MTMESLRMVIFALSIFAGMAFAIPGGLLDNTQQPSQETTGAGAPEKAQVLREYRGVELGMASEEVRKIMGKPELEEKGKERFKLGDGDLLTVYYDDGGAAKAIQLYFTNSKRAPAWAEVVGDTEVGQMESGAKHARRVVSEENFWVSMYQNKDGTMTTITISR